jgi:hypothetical protein
MRNAHLFYWLVKTRLECSSGATPFLDRGRQINFRVADYPPGKVVCCCTSTTLRRYPPGGVPRTCLKALPSRRDTCIALPQKYIKSEDFEQRLESPRPYPQPDGMKQKNES